MDFRATQAVFMLSPQTSFSLTSRGLVGGRTYFTQPPCAKGRLVGIRELEYSGGSIAIGRTTASKTKTHSSAASGFGPLDCECSCRN